MKVSKDADEKENEIIENLTYIICKYDINDTKTEINLVNNNFSKHNNLKFYINNNISEFSCSHKFEKIGEYNITFVINDTYINLKNMFNNILSLISIEMISGNESSITDIKGIFENCKNLTTVKIKGFTLEKNIISLRKLFFGLPKLEKIEIDGFHTNNVEDFSYIFANSNINEISLNINTDNAKNMAHMFSKSYSLISLNLQNINTKNVVDMSFMFYECFSLSSLNIQSFDTSKVISMEYMFYSCSSLSSLNITNFKTFNVQKMNYIFSEMHSLKSLDLSSFDTKNVGDMRFMFAFDYNLAEINIKKFDTQNAKLMEGMFMKCERLTQLDLSSFNTGKVYTMNCMFKNCTSLEELNIANFDTRNAYKYFNKTFEFCDKLKKILVKKDNKNCEDLLNSKPNNAIVVEI